MLLKLDKIHNINDIKIIKSSEIHQNPSNFFRKNVKLCGLPFKFQKRQSTRGKWATFQLNDLGGNCEVTLYSNTIIKYEHFLTQQKPVLLDAEVKNDSNQGLRIIAKKIILLEEFIVESKFNLVLILNDQNCIMNFQHLLHNLSFGPSNIFIECLVETKMIKIKIRENIKLSKKELSEVNQIASLRWQLSRASGVVNQRKDNNRSDDDVDKLGYAGEYAVAKLFNLHFNPSILGIDDGFDLWINDLSIDVKTTFYETGVLLFKSKDAFKADVGILVTATGSQNIFKIAGFISQKLF